MDEVINLALRGANSLADLSLDGLPAIIEAVSCRKRSDDRAWSGDRVIWKPTQPPSPQKRKAGFSFP